MLSKAPNIMKPTCLRQFLVQPRLHCVCVVVFLSLLANLPSATALSCYSNVDASMSQDCLSNTGCMKRFNQKTQATMNRGCFTPPVPPNNSTCTTDPRGFGICYCFTDLCNAGRPMASGLGTGFTMIMLSLTCQIILPRLGLEMTHCHLGHHLKGFDHFNGGVILDLSQGQEDHALEVLVSFHFGVVKKFYEDEAVGINAIRIMGFVGLNCELEAGLGCLVEPEEDVLHFNVDIGSLFEGIGLCAESGNTHHQSGVGQLRVKRAKGPIFGIPGGNLGQALKAQCDCDTILGSHLGHIELECPIGIGRILLQCVENRPDVLKQELPSLGKVGGHLSMDVGQGWTGNDPQVLLEGSQLLQSVQIGLEHLGIPFEFGLDLKFNELLVEYLLSQVEVTLTN
eukprot:maker-scaffold234_size243041-snap-gene-0.11 protein:Tk10939 transcript:maker-scaffold234_size243041-snap-gene-0.11-mRNA-1 annotation:"prostate stem cell antigen"